MILIFAIVILYITSDIFKLVIKKPDERYRRAHPTVRNTLPSFEKPLQDTNNSQHGVLSSTAFSAEICIFILVRQTNRQMDMVDGVCHAFFCLLQAFAFFFNIFINRRVYKL